MNTAYYHPFLDERVVRAALALPAEWRWTERPVALLIDEFAPELRDIPIEGRPWRFGGRSLRHLSRPRRRPRPRPAAAAGFNWRKQDDENLQSIFRDAILAAPRELFEIADGGAVKELLSRHPPGWPNQVWNLYTVAVLLSGSWQHPDPDLPPLTLEVPGS